MRAFLVVFAVLFATACVPTGPSATGTPVSVQRGLAPRDIVAVTRAVEPVAERLCRQEAPDLNCDFRMQIDRDPARGANAFQTEDASGRPVVTVTIGLIALMQSSDELAFVLGHEAGHHIARHRVARMQSASEGARILAGAVAARGADQQTILQAAQLGAIVGARQYSQGAELEADAFGTLIAYRAGFDPVSGSRIFTRLPDPAGSFLSTHPPHADRAAIVRRTAAGLGPR